MEAPEGFMKMRKFQSDIADSGSNTLATKILKIKERKLSDLMEKEVELLAEPEDPSKSIQQLYDVICSESKITVSPMVSDTEDDPRISLQIPSVPCKGQTSLSRVGFRQWIGICLLVVIGLVLVLYSDRGKKRRSVYRRDKYRSPKKSRRSRY